MKKNLSEAEQLELGFTLQDNSVESDIVIANAKQYIDANDEKIIKILTLNGDKSRQDIQDYLQESKTKIHQRLTKLIELKLIDKRGQSRAIVYFVNANERK